jgi:pimeloyl-ACP methyl ester carboxylesterase
VVTAALGDLGYGTLRVLFRPIDWIRRPTRSEFRRRLPIARAAVRWVRRSQPDSQILLAGGSIGAMLSARLASSAGVRGVVLVSPPFRNRRMGDSYRRWASALDAFAGPKLLVIGDRDDEWAPLDLVRTVIRSWPAPVSLEVIRGAGHGMKGVEDSLRAAILRWGRLQEDHLS